MSTNDPYSLHGNRPVAGEKQKALVKSLGDHPFLEGLTEEQLEVLAANVMPVEFTVGEIIFNEGESANRFYLIQEGEVALESAASDDEEAPTVIGTIGAGEVLGWSWMFAPHYWRFGARAVQKTRALFFYGTRLREECEHNPKLGFALAMKAAEIAIQRLQATRKTLSELKRRR